MDDFSPEQPRLQPPPVATDIPQQPMFYEPTQEERTFATLAHALQMAGWWIAPLIILLSKSYSRFVKFHALQALLLQIVHTMVYILGLAVWIAFIFGSIASTAAKGNVDKFEPPIAIFAFMPILWLLIFGMWVLILVWTIMYSIKAGKGEWAGYPLFGRLARYILNF